MPRAKKHSSLPEAATDKRDRELAALLDRGSRPPGVAEAIELYEAAEAVYGSTIAEPAVRAATSTNEA